MRVTTTDGGPTAAASGRPGPTARAADLAQEQIKRRSVLAAINEYEQAA